MRKLMTIAILAALATCLYGCATTQKYGWYKQGVAEFDVENSLAQCEYEAAGGNNMNNRVA